MRVAHCVSGATRRLAVVQAQKLMKESIIDGLGGDEVVMFFVVHSTDTTYNGHRRGERVRQTGAAEAIRGMNESVGVGKAEVVRDPSCKNPRARARVNCCGLKKMRWHVAVGPLMQFWIDECFEAVTQYERSQKVKFDWVTRIRPDVACAGPLPSLQSLDTSFLHAVAKENQCFWDTLFLIPRHLLSRFREASFGLYKKEAPLLPGDNAAACPGNARQPEMSQFFCLLDLKVPIRIHLGPFYCFLLAPKKQDTIRGCERRLSGRNSTSYYRDILPLNNSTEYPFCGAATDNSTLSYNNSDSAHNTTTTHSLCASDAVTSVLRRIYDDVPEDEHNRALLRSDNIRKCKPPRLRRPPATKTIRRSPPSERQTRLASRAKTARRPKPPAPQ